VLQSNIIFCDICCFTSASGRMSLKDVPQVTSIIQHLTFDITKTNPARRQNKM